MSNQSMTLDGVDLGVLATYGLSVLTPSPADLEYLPLPIVDRQRVGQGDGRVTQGQAFDESIRVVDYVVDGGTPAALQTKLRNIAGILARTQTGEKSLVFDFDSDRTWQGRLITAFRPSVSGAGASGSITFAMNPPWASAASSTNDNDTVTGDTTISITNTGDVEADVVWIIKNGGAAAAGVSLHNTTRGELAVFGEALAANEWLKIDTSDWSVERSVDSGSIWTNGATGLSGTPPKLDAGSNSVDVLGLASGTLDWTYTALSR